MFEYAFHAAARPFRDILRRLALFLRFATLPIGVIRADDADASAIIASLAARRHAACFAAI